MIIYIRHGDDKRASHRFDEHLTKHGKKQSRKRARSLIKRYGVPDVIYSSPFYRTRKTRHYMRHVAGKVKTKTDARLSRYFTHTEQRHPDIRQDTRDRGPPIRETWDEFQKRVATHLKHVKRAHSKEHVVWCITHTLVLKHVAKLQRIPMPDHIEYLDYVVVS